MPNVRAGVEGVSLTFDAEKHEYKWAGVIVPSVTQIIRTMPGMEPRDNAGAEYHMSVGTAVHSVIAGQTSEADYPERWDEIEPYVRSWNLGVRAFNIRVHQFERREYSRRHRYAGTIDALGVVGIDGALIDMKTGSPADWHPLQTAAYAELLGTQAPKRRCCIYLDADSGLPKIVWHDNPGDIGAFLGWLNYARWAGVITT